MKWGPLLNGMALGWQALPQLHLLSPHFRLPSPCLHSPVLICGPLPSLLSSPCSCPGTCTLLHPPLMLLWLLLPLLPLPDCVCTHSLPLPLMLLLLRLQLSG